MKPGNPQAFPQSISPSGPFGGMTLRDWFAGQALAGIMATMTDVVTFKTDVIVTDCYDIADAMLAERECDR